MRTGECAREAGVADVHRAAPQDGISVRLSEEEPVVVAQVFPKPMNARALPAVLLAFAFLSATTQAGFHVMQIEQFIAGVNGNTSAQAIQLRLRGFGQNQVQASQVRAWDSTGANPLLLIDMTTPVPNGSPGDTILLASSAFNTIMASVGAYASDFTLTNTIPASYLLGGKITFEDDFGTIYWSLAFGNYTGGNTGDFTNDSDGDFGAPAVAPPTNAQQALLFTGSASDASTNNASDYVLSANPATVRNNAGSSFSVVPEPGSAMLLAAVALGSFAIYRRRPRT